MNLLNVKVQVQIIQILTDCVWNVMDIISKGHPQVEEVGFLCYRVLRTH